jgi:hypothetical protein
VYVLTAANGIGQAWQEQDLITHPTREYGFVCPLALSRNVADTLLIKGIGVEGEHGTVFVYMQQSSSSKWSMVQTITAPVSNTPGGRSLQPHVFGASIALSDDGLVAAVGQVQTLGMGGNRNWVWDDKVFHGAVHIYKRQSSASMYELVTSMFSEPGAAFYAPTFGWSVALSPDGSQLLVGAPGCCDTFQHIMSGPGAVVYFALEGGAWRFKVRVDSPNPVGPWQGTEGQEIGQRFGTSVAIAGGYGFVGAPGADFPSGVVYYWQLA